MGCRLFTDLRNFTNSNHCFDVLPTCEAMWSKLRTKTVANVIRKPIGINVIFDSICAMTWHIPRV